MLLSVLQAYGPLDYLENAVVSAVLAILVREKKAPKRVVAVLDKVACQIVKANTKRDK